MRSTLDHFEGDKLLVTNGKKRRLTFFSGIFVKKTYFKSQHSHTVEKWPQPSFLTTWYRLWKRSPIFTGWYPPENNNNVCIIFFPSFFSCSKALSPFTNHVASCFLAQLHHSLQFYYCCSTTLFCSARIAWKTRIYDSWISDFARFAVLCSCISVQQNPSFPHFFSVAFLFLELFANQWLLIQLYEKWSQHRMNNTLHRAF